MTAVAERTNGVLVNKQKVYFLSIDLDALIVKLDEWLCMVADNCIELSRAHETKGETTEANYWSRKSSEIQMFLLDRKTISSIPRVALRQRLLGDPELTPANIQEYIEALLKQYVTPPKDKNINWVFSVDDRGEHKLVLKTELAKEFHFASEILTDSIAKDLNCALSGSKRGCANIVRSILGWAV